MRIGVGHTAEDGVCLHQLVKASQVYLQGKQQQQEGKGEREPPPR